MSADEFMKQMETESAERGMTVADYFVSLVDAKGIAAVLDPLLQVHANDRSKQ